MQENKIYVFIGKETNFPSGIFSTFENAKEWIEKYSLNGILNEYPLDIGLYNWTIKKDFFTIKNESKFIQRFTCASMEHFHFENGKMM